MRRFRDVELGGRVMSATTGSAPSAPDVLAWLEDMLGTKVVDGYGSTEAGMIMLDGKLQRRCGGAGACCPLKGRPRAACSLELRMFRNDTGGVSARPVAAGDAPSLVVWRACLRLEHCLHAR